MRNLRALLVIVVAALFLSGALSLAAPAFAVEPACHETGDHAPAPDKHPSVNAALSCCAGVVPAPVSVDCEERVFLAPARAHLPPVAERLEGLARAPDPHPPRLA